MAASVGRYELVRELGRGGMAEVFLARRRGPGGVEKRLALKRIRRERARDPRLLEMFVEEARLSMTLAHKNIVPMFDFGRAGDELFLVMEYVDGADLAAALEGARAAESPLSAIVAAHVALEACQALDYAHRARGEDGTRHSIVHRDVTPRNVLLSYAGEVKLADFGVATSETDIGTGKVRGTPAYMAPEQAAGGEVDERADVFSLGLVLWEMLAGRRAYDGTDKQTLLAQARAAEVPPVADDAPAALREVVARAVARDPDDRFPSARAMQLALDHYLVSAREPGTAPPGVLLADWLVEVAPPQVRRTGEQAVVVPPALTGAAEVVTFLDDGAAELARVAPLAPSDATIRSVAETVAEDGDAGITGSGGATGDAGRSPSIASASAPRARWPLAAAAMVLVGGAAAFALTRSGSGSAAAVIGNDAAPQAAVADAAVAQMTPLPIDAGASDAAPLQPDAEAAPAHDGHHSRSHHEVAARVERGTDRAARNGARELVAVGAGQCHRPPRGLSRDAVRAGAAAGAVSPAPGQPAGEPGQDRRGHRRQRGDEGPRRVADAGARAVGRCTGCVQSVCVVRRRRAGRGPDLGILRVAGRLQHPGRVARSPSRSLCGGPQTLVEVCCALPGRAGARRVPGGPRRLPVRPGWGLLLGRSRRRGFGGAPGCQRATWIAGRVEFHARCRPGLRGTAHPVRPCLRQPARG